MIGLSKIVSQLLNMLAKLITVIFNKKDPAHQLYHSLNTEQLVDLLHFVALDKRIKMKSRRLIMAAIVHQESAIEEKESMNTGKE